PAVVVVAAAEVALVVPLLELREGLAVARRVEGLAGTVEDPVADLLGGRVGALQHAPDVQCLVLLLVAEHDHRLVGGGRRPYRCQRRLRVPSTLSLAASD